MNESTAKAYLRLLNSLNRTEMSVEDTRDNIIVVTGDKNDWIQWLRNCSIEQIQWLMDGRCVVQDHGDGTLCVGIHPLFVGSAKMADKPKKKAWPPVTIGLDGVESSH